jgi:metal-responsive CopG/Arc/MetJ family transcriptional regulator
MRRSTQSREPTVKFSVAIEASIVERVDELAALGRQSRSAKIAELVERALRSEPARAE